MLEYVARRVLLLVPVMFIIGTVAFFLLHLTPGDPATLLAGPEATQEEIAAIRQRLGLDDPVLVQLGRWYARAVRGDFGESLVFGRPVFSLILQRAEPTLLLTLLSLMIGSVVGVTLGVVAALRHNTAIDTAVMAIALVGMSMPAFWKLLMLILALSVGAGWFPVAGYVRLAVDPVESLRHLALPALSMGIGSAALIARMTRSSMLDVLREDYVRTARGKGLAERVVVYKHALKNAFMPVLTIMGLVVAIDLGGAVVTETVANIPGMGRLVVDSIVRRDYPMVQGLLITIAGIYMVVNLAVDVLYGLLDARIRYS